PFTSLLYYFSSTYPATTTIYTLSLHDALPILQKSNVEELNQINNEISTSMTNIKRNLNETVKKAEQETRDLVSNAKHGALVTNIIDALKYGAATSAITIPVLYFLLS